MAGGWQALAVQAGLQVAGGMLGGRSAKKKAVKAAHEAARAYKMKTDREILLMGREHEQNLSLGSASVYASNLQMSGSSQKYLDKLDYAYAEERDYAKKIAAANYRNIRRGGGAAGGELRIQGITAALTTGVKLWGNPEFQDWLSD